LLRPRGPGLDPDEDFVAVESPTARRWRHGPRGAPSTPFPDLPGRRRKTWRTALTGLGRPTRFRRARVDSRPAAAGTAGTRMAVEFANDSSSLSALGDASGGSPQAVGKEAAHVAESSRD